MEAWLGVCTPPSDFTPHCVSKLNLEGRGIDITFLPDRSFLGALSTFSGLSLAMGESRRTFLLFALMIFMTIGALVVFGAAAVQMSRVRTSSVCSFFVCEPYV
jgi:hypothetical protein